MDFSSLGGMFGGGSSYKSGSTDTATATSGGGPFSIGGFNVGSGSAGGSAAGGAADNTTLYVVIGAFTAIVIALVALKR